jgi:hypothetical protein
MPRSLSVQEAGVKRGSGVGGFEMVGGGGSCARLVVRVVCARAPSLISVHDPGGPGAGDMMDRVIPLGAGVAAARSIGAVHAVVAAGAWWSRPRRIRVTKGAHGQGHAGASASWPSARGVWWLRLSSLRAIDKQAQFAPNRSAVRR